MRIEGETAALIEEIRSLGLGYGLITPYTTFIIHARKAWLKGLSPRQNREVPPLEYERVYRIKQLYPQLIVVINGGITEPDDVDRHLTRVDGVMIGREAYHNPWLLAELESRFDGAPAIPEPGRHAAKLRGWGDAVG